MEKHFKNNKSVQVKQPIITKCESYATIKPQLKRKNNEESGSPDSKKPYVSETKSSTVTTKVLKPFTFISLNTGKVTKAECTDNAKSSFCPQVRTNTVRYILRNKNAPQSLSEQLEINAQFFKENGEYITENNGTESYYKIPEATIDWIISHVQQLEVNIKHLEDIKSDIKELKQHFLKKADSEYDVELPITNIEEFDMQLANESGLKEHMKIFFSKFHPTPISTPGHYGIALIFDDYELSKYNWDGSCGKLPFEKMTNINEVLYESWLIDGTVFDNYQMYAANMRVQFGAARNRRHKRKTRASLKPLSELT